MRLYNKGNRLIVFVFFNSDRCHKGNNVTALCYCTLYFFNLGSHINLAASVYALNGFCAKAFCCSGNVHCNITAAYNNYVHIGKIRLIAIADGTEKFNGGNYIIRILSFYAQVSVRVSAD